MKRNSDQVFNELLVLRCQEKDQEAVALLWKRWQPKVLQWAYGFLKDADLANEVAQESWLAIFQGLNRLKDPALFRFWAFRIVQRRSVDQIRIIQKKRKLAEELEVVISSQNGSDEKPELDMVGAMLKCIKDLPIQHQQILKLHYLEKHSVEALSKLIELPEGTIKSRLYYARKYLKEKLKEVNHE